MTQTLSFVQLEHCEGHDPPPGGTGSAPQGALPPTPVDVLLAVFELPVVLIAPVVFALPVVFPEAVVFTVPVPPVC